MNPTGPGCDRRRPTLRESMVRRPARRSAGYWIGTLVAYGCLLVVVAVAALAAGVIVMALWNAMMALR